VTSRLLAASIAASLLLAVGCTRPPFYPDPEGPDLAEVHALHARRLYWDGRYAEAVPFARRALMISEQVIGPEQEYTAFVVALLGRILLADAEYADAEVSIARALATRRAVLGPDHPAVAESLRDQAWLQFAWHADYAAAEALFEQAREICKRKLNPRHPRVAEILIDLATLDLVRGDPDRAQARAKKAAALIERLLFSDEQDRPAIIRHTLALASIYYYTGEYEESIQLIERAYSALADEFEPDHPVRASLLEAMSAAAWRRGRVAEAQDLAERSYRIRLDVLGPQHPALASSLDTLAAISWYRGEYELAESQNERALEIREAALGPDHPALATSLGNLGERQIGRGEYAQAAALIRRGLALRERALGPAHPAVAGSLAQLAEVYLAQGEVAEAAPLLKRALASLQDAMGRDHVSVGNAMYGLAEARRLQGDEGAARRLYEGALRIGLRTPGLDAERMLQVRPLLGLALLDWSNGGVEGARDELARAGEIHERIAGEVLPTGTESQALALVDSMANELDVLLSFQRAHPNDPRTVELAMTAVLRRKGRILDLVSGGVQRLRSGSDQGAALLEELSRARRDLSELVLAGPDASGSESYPDEVKASFENVRGLERRVRELGEESLGTIAPVALAEVQARIPDGSVLLEYVIYRSVEPSDPLPAYGGETRGSARLGAFVLQRDGRPQWFDLGKAEAVLEARRRFARVLIDRRHSVRAVRERGRALHDLLIQPLAGVLGDASALLIAPEGDLNLLPFGALVDGEGRYLLEGRSISYLTSGRDLVQLAENRSIPRDPVVIGAPDFDASQAKATGTKAPEGPLPLTSTRSARYPRAHFDPIPGTRKEAEALGDLLQVRPVTGTAASEARLRQVHSPGILHIATHGFFLPAEGRRAAPQASMGLSGGIGGLSFEISTRSGESPMLRSGLALAGANQRVREGDDGILTAAEFTDLDLSATQLVVLSACDTGLGEVEIGEGVYGLRRAVVIAGAESQVNTLWKVDDEATRILMERFYARLVAGEPRAEALRRVQMEFLGEGGLEHPYYWASFISIGAWGPVDLASARPGEASERIGEASRGSGDGE